MATGLDTTTTAVLATLKSALVADDVVTYGGGQNMVSSRASHPHPNSEILGNLLTSVFAKTPGYKSGLATGANADVAVTGLGFTPSVVLIFNGTTGDFVVKTTSMATTSGVVVTNAPAVTWDAADCVTLAAGGFTLHDEVNDVNVAGQDLHWVALGG
jgi:hypothetical protein